MKLDYVAQTCKKEGSMQMERDSNKEKQGWLQLAALILLFPALFFLCVFFPIWVGWTQRFP